MRIFYKNITKLMLMFCIYLISDANANDTFTNLELQNPKVENQFKIAGVYWLPDYPGFSVRTITSGNNNTISQCEDFNSGKYKTTKAKNEECKTENPGYGLTCYYDCKCASKYTITSCPSGQKLNSDCCGGKCTGCISCTATGGWSYTKPGVDNSRIRATNQECGAVYYACNEGYKPINHSILGASGNLTSCRFHQNYISTGGGTSCAKCVNKTCANYGYQDNNDTTKNCSAISPYSGKNCYSCSNCPSNYVSCTSPQTGVGSPCGGKYSSCQCPSGVTNCSQGCKTYNTGACSSVCMECKTRPVIPSDDNLIKLKIKTSSTNSTLSFYTISTNNRYVDWGDGNIEDINSNIISHKYSNSATYTVRIFGGISYLSINLSTRLDEMIIESLNLSGITKLDFSSAYDILKGSIPTLPSSLINANSMFSRCSGLTRNIPQLPNSIKDASSMFNGCSGLTGNIPQLPKSIKDASSMFSGCSGLTGNIPQLPSSLTNTTVMFAGCSGLTGNIPQLPKSLTKADSMFSGCSRLTGNIPQLPKSLTKAQYMFYGCSGLTGNIPQLPNSLTEANSMFSGCSRLTGNIPQLPKSLTKAGSMFYRCSGLTGSIPTLPSSLTEVYSMFNECSRLTGSIPTLPESLTEANGMFLGCSGLTGNIPQLPESLTEAQYMFSGCSRLTGNTPQLPKSLTKADSMFYRCSGLTGNIPQLPKSLTKAQYMFYGCSGLTGNIPQLPNSLTEANSMFSGCSRLTGNIPQLPKSLTKAGSMFYRCSGLTGSIPTLPNSLTNANSMFSGCSGLTGQCPINPPRYNNAMFFGTKVNCNYGK